VSVDQVDKRSVKGGSGHNKVAVEVDGLPLGRAGLRAWRRKNYSGCRLDSI
jgi:hypothetical protein